MSVASDNGASNDEAGLSRSSGVASSPPKPGFPFFPLFFLLLTIVLQNRWRCHTDGTRRSIQICLRFQLWLLPVS